MKWGLGPAMAWGKNTLELICCLARWHASNIKVKTRSVQSSDNFSNFCTFVCALLTISSAVSVVLFAPRTCNSHWRIGARSLGTSKQPQQAATYVFRFCMTFKLCICTAIAFQKRSCCDSLQLYWGCMESPSLCPSIFSSDSGPSYHLLSQPTSFENGAPLTTGSSSFCNFPTSISRSSFCNSRSRVCSYGLEHGSDRWCLITMPMLSTPVTGFS